MRITRARSITALTAVAVAASLCAVATPAYAGSDPAACTSETETRGFHDPDVFYNAGDTVLSVWDKRIYRAVAWNYGKSLSDTAWWVPAGCPSADPTKNLAREAKATASSEFDGRYSAAKAIDGIVGEHGNGEWASKGQSTPWITLTWDTTQVIDEIRVFDRPNLSDWAVRGTLYFSDGSMTQGVNWIENKGGWRTASFFPKKVKWVKFQIEDGTGNVGLSEIEAYHRGTGPAQPYVTEVHSDGPYQFPVVASSGE